MWWQIILAGIAIFAFSLGLLYFCKELAYMIAEIRKEIQEDIEKKIQEQREQREKGCGE